MKLIWLLLFVQVFYLLQVSSYPRRGECGPRLEKMLRDLCNRIYNGPSKKSVLDILHPKAVEFDEYNNEIPSDYSLDYYGYMDQKNAKSALSRKRRGIIEECCYSPCSRENLLMYCGK